MFRKLTAYSLLLTALLLFASMPALAQEPQEPSMDEVNDVAQNLNCPTCQSLNLADCRTQTCEQWRGQIKDLLAEGYTEQEILDWFSQRYGDEVLQEPPRRGFGLIVWLLPAIALLLGTIWLVYIIRKWSSQKGQPIAVTPQTPAPSTDEGDDYLKQVERDLGDL